MYVNVVEDGNHKCLWVLPKLENILRTHILNKQE